jgi:hypothetical protein
LHAVETLHAEVPEHFRIGKPSDAAPWLLVPSSEEVPDTVMDMMIDGPIRRQARAIAEIRRPAGQKPVQSSAHLGPWPFLAGSQEIADLGLDPQFTGELRSSSRRLPDDAEC